MKVQVKNIFYHLYLEQIWLIKVTFQINMSKLVSIKVLTADPCGGCLILNYNSSLRQEHIHNLSCKAGKTHNEMHYPKYISSYCKNKS